MLKFITKKTLLKMLILVSRHFNRAELIFHELENLEKSLRIFSKWFSQSRTKNCTEKKAVHLFTSFTIAILKKMLQRNLKISHNDSFVPATHLFFVSVIFERLLDYFMKILGYSYRNIAHACVCIVENTYFSFNSR